MIRDYQMEWPNDIKEYNVEHRLGKGAFGVVWAARWLDERIAIKMINKALIKGANMKARVRNEVMIHYRLNHPNILKLFHFFEDSENVYLVMERAERGELYRVCRDSKTGGLSAFDCCRVFKGIVDGLSYLHSHGILHRDLKMSNILLCDDGGMIGKIADFGLAVGADEGEIDDERGGVFEDREQLTLCGTPNYLAPEIIQKRPYGKSADLWSLGCLFYSVLVGRAPFEAENIRETFGRVKRADFKIPASVDRQAADLISRLLLLEPSDRILLSEIGKHPFFSTLLPIQTNTLRPFTQKTKHAQLSINQDLTIRANFFKDGSSMAVSRDGQSIHIHHNGRSMQFQWPSVPSQIAERYLYVKKFCSLLSLKCPRCVVRGGGEAGWKAFLMGDGSFQLQTRTNRIEFDGNSKIRIKTSTGSRYVEPDGDDEGLLREMKEIYRFANSQLALCDPQKTKFPIVVDNYTSRHVSLFPNNNHTQNSWSSSESSKNCINHAFASLSRNRNDSMNPKYPAQNSSSIWNPTTHSMIDMPTLLHQTLSSLPPTSQDEEGMDPNYMQIPFEYTHKTFIPALGWCLSTKSQLMILFLDGQTCLLKDNHQIAHYHPDTNRTTWYSIESNQRLPDNVCELLVHVPKFVRLLREGHGHSFVK